MDGVDFVNWGGVVPFFFGGFCWALTYSQTRYARKLAEARRVEKLEGMTLAVAAANFMPASLEVDREFAHEGLLKSQT